MAGAPNVIPFLADDLGCGGAPCASIGVSPTVLAAGGDASTRGPDGVARG